MDKEQLNAAVDAIEAQSVSIRQHRPGPLEIVPICDRLDASIAALRALVNAISDAPSVPSADDQGAETNV